MKRYKSFFMILGVFVVLTGWLITFSELATGNNRSGEEGVRDQEKGKANKITDPLDLIPGKAAVFQHYLIPEILQSNLGKEVIKAIGEKKITESENLFGVPITDLKTISVVIPDLDVNSLKFQVIYSTVKPYDREKVKKIFVMGKPLLKAENTDPDWIVVNRQSSLHFRDANTFVFLSTDYKKEYLSFKRESGPTDELIQKAKKGTPAVAYLSFATLGDEVKKQLPLQLKPFLPLLELKQGKMTLELGEKLNFLAELQTDTAKQSREMELSFKLLIRLAESQITEAKANITKVLKDKPNNSEKVNNTLELVEKSEKLLKKIQFSQKENQLKIEFETSSDSFPAKNIVLALTEGISGVRASSEDAQRSNNAKQIMLAMHNYHDAYRKFPSAAINGKKGKRLLSWRVAILPYIEEQKLYESFRLDEPWDSENNKKLLPKMPKMFALPSEDPTKGKTHFRVFVGKSGISKLGFDYLQGRTIPEMIDGTSSTIALVEAKEAIEWTKPEELSLTADQDPKSLLLMYHNRYLVAMFDGSVRFLSEKISKTTLLQALTIDGGEVLGSDFE